MTLARAVDAHFSLFQHQPEILDLRSGRLGHASPAVRQIGVMRSQCSRCVGDFRHIRAEPLGKFARRFFIAAAKIAFARPSVKCRKTVTDQLVRRSARRSRRRRGY